MFTLSQKVCAVLYSLLSPRVLWGIFMLICPWDFVMRCGKSFIGFILFTYLFIFYTKLIADITLDGFTSLLSLVLYSFVFILVTHSCLRLQEGDMCTLGRHFLSVCDIKYARLPSLNKAPSLSNSLFLTLSLSNFLIPVLLFSLCLRQTNTRKYTNTPLGPNHWKQQTVVNASPRSACCCVAKRKKK